MIIYKVTNLINGKLYIGQTTQTFEKRRQQHENSINYKSCDRMVFTRALRKYGIDNFEWKIIDEAKTQDELDEKEIYWIDKLNTIVDSGKGYNSNFGGNGGRHSELTKFKIGDAQKGSKNHMFGVLGEDHHSSKKVMNMETRMIYDSATECSEIEGVQQAKVCAVCRGDRATTNNTVYRYVDEDGSIIEPEEIKTTQKNREVVNHNTGEKFYTLRDASSSMGYKNSSTLATALRAGDGVCWCRDSVWYYSDIDISKIEKLPTKPIRSDAKKVLNITTGEVYPSITSVGKNYRNLATALRKRNGKCIWRKEEWRIVD